MKDPQELRRRVAALGPRTRGTPIPEQLRAELTRYAVERRRRGDAVREIARAVGLSPESIRRWTMASPTRRRRALVPVVVHDHDEDRAGISVVAPSGYRVEGLTVASVAALLRELA